MARLEPISEATFAHRKTSLAELEKVLQMIRDDAASEHRTSQASSPTNEKSRATGARGLGRAICDWVRYRLYDLIHAGPCAVGRA
jgi:hypothetical protein